MTPNQTNYTAISTNLKTKPCTATGCPEGQRPKTPIENELDNLQCSLNYLGENISALLVRLNSVMSLAENSDTPVPTPEKQQSPIAICIRERAIQIQTINNLVTNILQHLEC